MLYVVMFAVLGFVAADEDAEINKLIAVLGTFDGEAKQRAIDELVKLGPKAKPATRALCDQLYRPSPLHEKALSALALIRPDLHKWITTIIVSDKPSEHVEAMNKLRAMGAEAKDVAPFIARHADQPEFQSLAVFDLSVLAAIAPRDSDTVDLAKRIAKRPRVTTDEELESLVRSLVTIMASNQKPPEELSACIVDGLKERRTQRAVLTALKDRPCRNAAIASAVASLTTNPNAFIGDLAKEVLPKVTPDK